MDETGLLLGTLLAIGLLVFLVHFLAKKLSRDFTERSVNRPESSRRQPVIRPGFILSLLITFGGVFLLFNISTWWPPHWLERIQQRKIVIERVKNTGGWEVIKKDCSTLVMSNAATGYQWFERWGKMDQSAPDLPKSVAALKPRMVDLYYEKDRMCSVRIGIFGMHSTGGRGQDFYTLKVICPLPPNIRPPFRVDEKSKARYGNRRIADGVFEETHKS